MLASVRISVYRRAVLLALSLLAAVPPGADEPLMPPIARADLIAAYRQMLAVIDSDRDGLISRAEWSASTELVGKASRASPIRVVLDASPEDMFRLWDSDQDGLLAFEELVRPPLASFDCMDADHDGVVQPGEADLASQQSAC